MPHEEVINNIKQSIGRSLQATAWNEAVPHYHDIMRECARLDHPIDRYEIPHYIAGICEHSQQQQCISLVHILLTMGMNVMEVNRNGDTADSIATCRGLKSVAKEFRFVMDIARENAVMEDRAVKTR